MCNAGALLKLVMGYAKKAAPDDPAQPPALYPDQLFTNASFTTPLADGYYKRGTSTYYRIVGEK